MLDSMHLISLKAINKEFDVIYKILFLLDNNIVSYSKFAMNMQHDLFKGESYLIFNIIIPIFV